ncbi:hypothetical protein DXG03_002322 [Asterophora parasitica]|uniref:Kinetochore protein Sos7 coiled-coil domain-containing protein n=1 Tax=Asterophora parasitica TaxID=117018 RepID=A0A9P7G4G6_9AGAR|nr:hypothetical protein DXG03_002322 [Asterophora parasitica]
MHKSQRRSSYSGTPEQEKLLKAAESLKAQSDSANLQLLRNVSDFKSWKLKANENGADDTDDLDPKDPAIVAADVAAQISFLRKLKFQYLEQNAKDRYVKSIVSDIDDAPIVTADDNKTLLASNAAKKEKLKVTKSALAEMQHDIRTLSPLVEKDYRKVHDMTSHAAQQAQKIIDTRLALARLRKTHPHPRLTIPLADQKLIDQVTQMQELSDELNALSESAQAIKDQVKKDALELEARRAERAEVERAVKATRVDEDDGKLVPLYEWYTASVSLHRSINDLHKSYAASENELQLTYNIEAGQATPHHVTITLIFAPDTRQLAAVQTTGLEELGVELGDLIDAHVQVNDVQGVVAAILSRARTRGVSSAA